jgi:dolichyl-phosphate beta-glucosyltransferase
VTRTLPEVSYVLPVHNQASVLVHSVRRLQRRLERFAAAEILLIENGSSDGSPELCTVLACETQSPSVSVRTATSAQGMGHALRTGMSMAEGELLVLTAADLPFGFSDLDTYLGTTPRPDIAIGSKAHPRSRVDVPLQRRAMSGAFRLLRAAALGLRVGDSQGTLFISSRLAKRVAPHLACGDFLISTEIVCWAVEEGASPVELPVTYPRSAQSTVSPWSDSARMVAGTFALRRRLRARRPRLAAAQRK